LALGGLPPYPRDVRAVRNVAIFLVVVWLVVGVIQPQLDRANRTRQFPGVVSTGSVHVAPDGRMIIVDAAGRRAMAVDASTGIIETLIDGLEGPRAAHVGADGTTCVADQGPGLTDPPTLTCTGDRLVDLGAIEEQSRSGSRPDVSDVVSDGTGGWYVSDAGRNVVVRVDGAGRTTVVAEFAVCADAIPAAVPAGLALGDDGTLFIALLDQQVATFTGEPIQGCANGLWVGGNAVLAVIPRGGTPIVLVREAGTGTGTILSHPGLDAADQIVLSGIQEPRGAALLPDGRVAVSAASGVSVYDPAVLPGY
jgi:hypothetical protein